MEKRLRVETHSRSIYIIDPVAKTWERTYKSPDSGDTRTESGQYNGLRLELGEAMLLICDPYIADGPTRLISTSFVIAINEFEV
jgi:hypothetical protein